MRNGQGKLSYASGDIFEGYWKDDQYHGYGVYMWAHGDRYTGQYVEHQMNGEGQLEFVDGSLYVGNFRDNSINGFGTMFSGKQGSKNTKVLFCGIWKDASPVDFVPLENDENDKRGQSNKK